jgi:hypothetical protein
MPPAERKSSRHDSDDNEGRHRTAARPTPVVVMRKAAEQLAELLGTAPDSVSALQPQDDGWRADVEVIEIQRVPDTTSVMATYRVTLDSRGQLLGYERTRRYARGQIDREDRRR